MEWLYFTFFLKLNITGSPVELYNVEEDLVYNVAVMQSLSV